MDDLTFSIQVSPHRERDFFVTFTQGGASLALGYFLTPSNGAL